MKSPDRHDVGVRFGYESVGATWDEDAVGVESISHPEVTATYQGQSAMRTALEDALRPGRRTEALPKAVMRRLTSATVFPNQPCPCGSGQKQKHCCRR